MSNYNFIEFKDGKMIYQRKKEEECVDVPFLQIMPIYSEVEKEEELQNEI